MDMDAAMSAVLIQRWASSTCRAPMPVITLEPLMVARPSRASNSIGSSPLAARASRAGKMFPSRYMSPSPMRVSDICDRGARSPQAPTLPRLHITGVRPALRILAICCSTTGRNPECPLLRTLMRLVQAARLASAGAGSPCPAA